MFHSVESCPLTMLNGGLSRLHAADEDTVSCLTNYGSWHAYENWVDCSRMDVRHKNLGVGCRVFLLSSVWLLQPATQFLQDYIGLWSCFIWLSVFLAPMYLRSQSTTIRQPPSSCRSPLQHEHVRPSGLLCCWPNGLELTARQAPRPIAIDWQFPSPA